MSESRAPARVRVAPYERKVAISRIGRGCRSKESSGVYSESDRPDPSQGWAFIRSMAGTLGPRYDAQREPVFSKRVVASLKFLGTCAYLVGLPTLVLWLSGNWRWLEGLISGVWFSLVMGAALLWFYYKDPALLSSKAGHRRRIALRSGYSCRH